MHRQALKDTIVIFLDLGDEDYGHHGFGFLDWNIFHAAFGTAVFEWQLLALLCLHINFNLAILSHHRK